MNINVNILQPYRQKGNVLLIGKKKRKKKINARMLKSNNSVSFEMVRYPLNCFLKFHKQKLLKEPNFQLVHCTNTALII